MAEARLRRSLGATAAGAFVVSNMVGSGIFIVPAFVRAAVGGSLAALGVWAVGALLALCGALCYAELATRMPQAGGEYTYLRRVYGPLWGFLSGWMSFFVGFSAAMAASSLGVVAYAAAIVPGWNPQALLLPGLGITQGAGVAALLLLALAGLHALGVGTSGRVQSLLAGSVLAALGAFVIAGLASGNGEWRGVTLVSAGSSSWWLALLQVMFAYSGWNAATYLAGEVRDPQRSLPRALIGGTLLVALAYLALNILFFYALPIPRWQAELAVGAVAAGRLFGATGSIAISAVIALAIFGSVSAMTAAGPRVYFAMAQDGLAPALLRRLGQSSRAPAMAILAQAMVAAVLALTGAFEALLIYIGSSLLGFSGLAVAALMRLRWRREQPAAETLFRLPGYPLPPLIFLGMVVLTIGNGVMHRPVPTAAAAATVLLGVAVYGVASRKGWLRPMPTAGLEYPDV